MPSFIYTISTSSDPRIRHKTILAFLVQGFKLQPNMFFPKSVSFQLWRNPKTCINSITSGRKLSWDQIKIPLSIVQKKKCPAQTNAMNKRKPWNNEHVVLFSLWFKHPICAAIIGERSWLRQPHSNNWTQTCFTRLFPPISPTRTRINPETST